MTDKIKFKQCKLKKGKRIQTTWVESKYAIEGMYLNLAGDDGWYVVKVYEIEKTGLELRVNRDAMKHMNEVISK